MKRLAFITMLCTLIITGSGWAQQQFPTLERGLQPEKLYHFAGIDNVNIFNGNLTIILPIGQSYPLDGGLGYQLSLSYNSNLWDWEMFRYIDGTNQKRAIPARRSNAGVGWILGAGAFIPRSDPTNNSFADVYGAPDGGDHRFDKSTDLEPNVAYTTDGSNLRLRKFSGVAYIDFPDGSVQRFEQDSDLHWPLREIDAPRGGAKVIFAKMSSRPSQCGIDTTLWWHISDGTRNHYICYKNRSLDFVDTPMVETIYLDGPQNQPSIYRFTYDTFFTFLQRGELVPTAGFETLFVQTAHRVTVLKSIVLPDQSSYKFEHDPDRYAPVLGLFSDANLLSVTLPTGGRLEYTYGEQYDVPPIALCTFGVPTDASGSLSHAIGTPATVITNRTVRSVPIAGATAEVGTWSYGWRKNGSIATKQCMTPGGPSFVFGDLTEELIAQVTDPDGNRTDAHFSVWPGDMIGDSEHGFKSLYYGFPYGTYDSKQNRYLSTETLRCAGAQCTPLRTTYVRHDIELRDKAIPSLPNVAMPIHRQASQRIFYRDDPNGCDPTGTTSPCSSITTDATEWDGLGHYRVVQTTHDFDGGGMRKVTTDFNKPGGTQRVIASSDPWVPNEYENRTIEESGAATVNEQACFDAVPGNPMQRFLRATRLLKGTSPGAADTITLFSLKQDGNLDTDRYYGGDKTPLTGGATNAASLCSAVSSLTAPAYEVSHTWNNGVMATSQFTGASFLSSNLTIDRSGLVTESRDPAGVLTKYSYDPSGRIVRIEPSGVSAIAYSYSNAVFNGSTLFQPATAVARRDSSNDPTENDFFFDSLGRVWREKTQMPNGKYRVRETLFDSLSRHRSVSEWADLPKDKDPLTLPITNITLFGGYDAFGRVGSTRTADGAFTSFTYVGDRIKTKTASIATLPNGQASVPTTERYDGFGRLISVIEPSGVSTPAYPNGSDVTTEYTYDTAGHLATVKMTDEHGVHQDRTFQYDGRGFLTKESHPENLDTTYDSYDARGHVITRTNGGTTLTFEYDAVERLRKVTDQAEKVIKQYDYGTLNSDSDLRNGKIVSATRRNDLQSVGRVDVTETYEYKSIAGMMSKRTTSVERVSADGNTHTPIQQFAYGLSNYDDLLLPTAITMPTCSLGDCSAATTQNGAGTVTISRNSGFLTDVIGFGSLTYQPSGMVENVVHATPQLTTDKYAARFGQARPSKITFAACGNTAPTFLPGNTIVKPFSTGTSCGLQVTWPPAVICGGSSDVRYRVLRDGVDITGPNCLTSPKFVDQSGVVLGVTYAYTIVAEGPAVAGLQNPGRCQQGQTTQLPTVSGKITSCPATATLTVSPVIASVGIPATFRATLSSSNGPAVGEELIFSVNSEEIGRARTGADGTALLSHAVDVEPTTYPDAIAVTYAGGVLPATTKPVTATLKAICSEQSYTIKPISLNVLSSGGPFFDVFVNTSSHCQWNPIANATQGDNPFLQVSPTSTRTGKGTFNISIPANDQPGARSSHVEVGLQFISVDQGGVGSGCTYRFVPEIAFISAETGSVDVVMPVTATSGCHWTASADPSTPWIHFNPQDSTASSGIGNGQIHFSVESNLSTLKREAIVLLSDGAITVAKGFMNQLAPLPAVCPITFIEDLHDGSVEKGQNIPLRVYTTGTRLKYQWFVNDVQVRECQDCPTMTLGYFTEGYPAPGHSTTFQVRVSNSCDTAFSSRVTWQNNATTGQCIVPVVQDSLERPNEAPSDSVSPFPGTPVTLFAPATHADFSTSPPLTFTWYRGLPGDRSSKIATNPDDGFQDHVTVNPFDTSFYWVEITDACGSQQSRSAAVFTTIPPAKRRAVGKDFTGDGKSDIAWHNAATGQNEIWQMNGTMHASTIALPANQDHNAQLQSTGDLNADGNTDIVWRDPQTGQNEVWLMNRTQLTEARPIESRTGPWTIGAVADYDNDNNDDIAWHNSATGANEIWFNTGTDHAGTWALPSNTDAQWGLYGAGDFNNDEKPDLFFHNRTTGENQIWLMDDATLATIASKRGVISAKSVGTSSLSHLKVTTKSLPAMTDTNWVPALVADMDGDGRPDIVWRNVVTGENSVWIMSGTQVAQTVPIEPRADVNWQIGGGGSSVDGSSSGGGPASHGPTALHVVVDPAAVGDPAAVTATLTAAGVPVAQHQLVFTLSGTEVTRLVTDATGSATAIIATGTRPSGTYPNAISVRFDGDDTYDASTQSADLVITSAEASVTWKNPDAIVFGTALSATQLNATASTPGTFVYTPVAGAILNAGFQTLKVTFTPNDAAIAPITRTAVILVNKAPSSASWTTPDAIGYGTPLSDLQLNATSTLSGTFTYDPPAGTTLAVGNGQVLHATFQPDSTNFDVATVTTTIDVGKGNQFILWNDPAPITVLQPLTAAQLAATIVVSGSAPHGPVTYDPPLGTTLTAGVHALLVSVGATDSYEAASASVDLIVLRVSPNLQWAQPAPIVYGTALSTATLNATADVPGTFTYTPPAGTILDAGTQQLSVAFTPTDSRYDAATASVNLQVSRATQSIAWSNPAPITYGTLLSATQLNAQVSVVGPSPAGRLAYTQPVGYLLSAGSAQTLTVFAVATQNYDAAAASVTIDVLKATPVLTWTAPASIVYGTPLSATQLNATANVPGTFVYTPAAGTILNAGASQTLQTVFTPTDAQDYATASRSTPLTVTKANQVINWPNPADIVYGTLLSSTQLNATISVVGPAPAGELTYTPPAGTLLQTGPGQTLSVTAAQTPNYNAATATALLTVQKGKPILTWAKPSSIVYGSALSSTQLNAAANVPGSFVYTPPAGTILNAGTAQTLTVAFTPTDTHNFESAAVTTTIDVAKATQTLSWSAPAAIVYGARLSATQLNATVSVVGPAVAGTLVYTPSTGIALDSGAAQTLTVTAQETPNYLPATTSVSIDVNRAPLTLRVDNQTKLYGAPLPALTGTLTGVVNGDPITPQYATTATIASVVGTYPITGQLANPNNRLRNYDVTIVAATLTISRAPLVVSANAVTKQYSDPLPQLMATFQGFVLGETPAVLSGTLLLQTTATKDSGPGTYPITIGGLTSTNYGITFVAGTLTVTQEDAVVGFIAPLTVASPLNGNVTVTLASLIKEAPETNGGSGPSPGDIRKATLTFVNRATGLTLCSAPIGLITSSDSSAGIATCTFTANVKTYIVETRVGGWYTRDSATDDATLSVLAANDDFVTGSGSAQLTGSSGSYAADANSRTDFDLNPKYDKSGTVKGSVTLTFHRTENGSGHTYQIITSSIASLAITRTAAGGIAWITGPASLTDVTNSKSPIVINGNAALFASFTDNGEPATNDTLAVTLLANNGGLLFSSKWNGSRTADQTINNGNIQVHQH